MIRAVLDTNVLVSALIGRQGAPAALLDHWQSGAFELVVSPALMEELAAVLARPKLRRYVEPEEAREFLDLLRNGAVDVDDPADRERLAPDPLDDFVVGVARSTASVLVTGDGGLGRVRVAQLAVLSPRAFLDAIEE